MADLLWVAVWIIAGLIGAAWGLIDWLRRLWRERNQLEDDLRAAINRPDMED